MTISKFNGGFFKSLNINNPILTLNVNSDEYNTFKIIDDNTTFRSKLQPVFLGTDISSYIRDYMLLEVFWDSTTYTLPGIPEFIEPPPDDYHPMPEIEYAEGSTPVGWDRYVRTPHFVLKPDATSNYYGKDRYDNFIAEPLSNFGGQFTWFDNFTTQNTFNGGDLYSTPTGLHLSFMYLKAKDATAYIADLYYSKFSDFDGTFANPILIDNNIDVAGIGGSVSVNPQYMNRKTNPRFLYVPKLGLLLNVLRSGFNVDSTEYYIDMKLSRDDGTNWSNYNAFPAVFFTNEKDSAGFNLPVNEHYCPYMHWVFAENKIVCLMEFRDARSDAVPREHINILISEDLGKTFKQVNIDFMKILSSLSSQSLSNNRIYIPGSIHYDTKISKFVMTIAIYGRNTTATSYSLMFLVNRDSNLLNWDISLFENTSDQPFFSSKGTKPWLLGFKTNGLGGTYFQGHSAKFVAYTDPDNISWVVMNGGMSFKKPSSGAAFDSYLDYSGLNPAVSVTQDRYAWIPNPILFPLEIVPSTDSYLNQFRFATAPWRARKLLPGNVSHTNNGGTTGITPAQGSSINPVQDGIILNGNETYPAAQSGINSSANDNPNSKFYIHSLTKYKNDFWMLGGQQVLGPSQENRFIDYQIPTLIHHPGWSNINIKARKIYHLTPTRYHDSTFVGWSATPAAAGQEIKTIFPPETKKYWEIKFARTDAAQGATTACGLEHLGNSTAFLGIRGSMWDADATRGAFAHFGVTLDSQFQADITSMIHHISIPQSSGTTTNKTLLSTFLGRGHFAFRSSGSVATNMYSTFPIDSTRDMEFLMVVNRFGNVDTTHEHRGFFKYRGSTDWTFMYYNLCLVGASFSSFSGIRLGNLWRWPTSIVGDTTNVVYFKFHSEGWSNLEMHRYYPSGVGGVLTPSSDNKLAVQPVACTHGKTFLPRGLQIAWAGQDATANARFKIVPTKFKNSIGKIFDSRPNIGWKTLDGTTNVSLIIDFGESVIFDTVSMYNHNIWSCRFSYGQENSTTDFTNFLVHEQSIPLDATDFLFRRNFSQVQPTALSVVDSNTLLIYDQDFMKYYKSYADDIIGKTFTFWDNLRSKRVAKQCIFAEILNDSSVYIQFKNPSGDNWLTSYSYDFLTYTFTSESFYVLETKHLYVLPQVLNARYIKMDFNNSSVNWNQGSRFDGFTQPNFEGYFKLGNLDFGLFQQNENPIENKIKISYLSPSSLQSKYAGGQVPIQVTDIVKRRRFDTQINASSMGHNEQFGQLDNFFKNIGGNRDPFYFNLNKLSQPDGVVYTESSLKDVYGFKYSSNDFYFVRMTNQPNIQKRENLANINLVFEEVI